MKENLRIGKIKWFGGWNNKKLRNNNFGVVQYETGEEVLRIFEFSDYTKNLHPIDYGTLKNEYVISFEENNKKKVLLIRNENTFKNFSSEELVETLKKDLENNLKEPFLSNITLLMLKNIMYKDGDFSFLYKNGIYNLLNNKNLFRIISTEKFIKYFALKEEFFLLYYLEDNIPKYDVIRTLTETEKLYEDLFEVSHTSEYIIETKGIDIESFLEKESKKRYQDFKRSCDIIMRMNPFSKKYFNSTKRDFEFNKYENFSKDSLTNRICIENLKKNPPKKLEVIKNASIKEVKNYIKENIKFENCNDIKNFIKYITIYEFSLELEDLFIKDILKYVEKKFENCYLIEEYLYYFDGQIIFNKEENNKLYDELRLNVLNRNLKLKIFLTEILLDSNNEDTSRIKERKLCYRAKKSSSLVERKDVFYNRIYYSHIKDKNLKLALEKNVLSIYDFKNGKNNTEVLKFLYGILKKLIPSEFYNYTIIPVPSSSRDEKIGLFNLIKFICLLTGMKNGFKTLKTIPNKILTPKRFGGKGIIGNIVSDKVKTKYAILFDDVYTSGKTLSYCNSKLVEKNKNIQVPFYVVFAKTQHKDNIKLEDLFYKDENKEENSWFIEIEIFYNNQYNTKYYSFKKIDKKEIENYLTQSYLLRKLLREIVPKEYQAQLCEYSCTFTNIKNEKIRYKITKDLDKELDEDLSRELYENLE